MRAARILLLAMACAALGGCATVGIPAGSRDAIAQPYVAGHYGQNGFWVPGHYRQAP